MVTENKKNISKQEFVTKLSKEELTASEMDELFLDY